MIAAMRPLSPALVVVGHGSRSPSWVAAFDDFVAEVSRTPGLRDVFASVTGAYLENAAPALADAVESQLALGVSEVVVVPVFLTASTHLSEDVPGILALPGTAPHIARRLQGEGVRVLPAGLPVKLAHLRDLRTLLHLNISRRLALACRDPAHEAVVLVGYGSAIHHEEWEALMHGVRTDLLTDGWSATEHGYCGHVVPSAPQATADAITAAARQAGVRRVHVKSLLLAPSGLQTGPIAAGVEIARAHLQKRQVEVLFDGDAILPDGDLALHAGHAALHAQGITPPFANITLRKIANDA